MSEPIPNIENGEQTPRAIATAWFSRQRSGQMTATDEVALRDWLEADGAHRDSYRAVRAAWSELGAVRANPRVMAMREELEGSKPRRTRKVAAGALAACLVAGILVLLSAAVWQWRMAPRPLGDHTFATALGERATITLPDGSELTLNTDTVVRTRADASRRLVYLDKGQAYFVVAKDARRPFIVSAAGRTITALGTAFDVRVDQGVFEVTLVEGKVRVESSIPPTRPRGAPRTSVPDVQATEMTAGTQLLAPGDGEWRLIRANTVVETSWTRGQLIFDNALLKDVVTELNRYSDKRMVVPSESLQNTPISGNFKPGDIDGFVHALEQFGLARGDRSVDGAIELRPLG